MQPTPGHPARRATDLTAGLLARGSPPVTAFPGIHPSGIVARARRLQLRGQLRIGTERSRTAFPIHSSQRRDRQFQANKWPDPGFVNASAGWLFLRRMYRLRWPASRRLRCLFYRIAVPWQVQPQLTLVLGGARSGKSRYAEQARHGVAAALDLCRDRGAVRRRDDGAHRRASQPPRRAWQTVEAPLDLAGAIASAPPAAAVLVDCLTLWLSQSACSRTATSTPRRSASKRRWRAPGAAWCWSAMKSGPVSCRTMREARRFRDLQGRLNQRMAARADRVVLLVAGLPLVVKGQP